MKITMSLLFGFVLSCGMVSGTDCKMMPVPVTYIMVCCHGADKGTKFLANGEWDTKHDYRDYAFARDQMRKIKEAGINVVGVDFTNPSQWDQFKAHHWPMLENVAKAAAELDMQYHGQHARPHDEILERKGEDRVGDVRAGPALPQVRIRRQPSDADDLPSRQGLQEPFRAHA